MEDLYILGIRRDWESSDASAFVVFEHVFVGLVKLVIVTYQYVFLRDFRVVSRILADEVPLTFSFGVFASIHLCSGVKALITESIVLEEFETLAGCHVDELLA